VKAQLSFDDTNPRPTFILLHVVPVPALRVDTAYGYSKVDHPAASNILKPIRKG
jgi:hypothetical protein